MDNRTRRNKRPKQQQINNNTSPRQANKRKIYSPSNKFRRIRRLRLQSCPVLNPPNELAPNRLQWPSSP